MERSSSLDRVQEVKRKTIVETPKDEVQVVRWRGRRIVIRRGAPFPWWKEDNEPTGEELALEKKAKSPVELLLKILRRSQSK